ncbi:MAG: hypothetical protein ABW250_02625 [Pyrinomonadaceae bacterium]
MLSFILQGVDVLRYFAQNREAEGWRETAASWLTTAIVVAVVWALVMLFVKLTLRKKEALIKDRAWSRPKTWWFIFAGLIPVLLIAGGIYYFSLDFPYVVGFQGLINGVLFSWFLYVCLMVGGHLISSWRRDIY